MTDNVRQTNVEETLLTIDGRDPAWTNRMMGELWAHANKLGLKPVRWKVGFFNLRDVILARDPAFRWKPYDRTRIESVWGCEIDVVCLWDQVELIAADNARPGIFTTIVPGDR